MSTLANDAPLIESLGQSLAQNYWIEMREMNVHVVLVWATAAPLANLLHHATRDKVARREVFLMRRIALHEPLAM